VEVRNVRWIGISTENYAAMRDLFEAVMGLRVNFDETTTVEWELSWRQPGSRSSGASNAIAAGSGSTSRLPTAICTNSRAD
jgi:hypothetical protein